MGLKRILSVFLILTGVVCILLALAPVHGMLEEWNVLRVVPPPGMTVAVILLLLAGCALPFWGILLWKKAKAPQKAVPEEAPRSGLQFQSDNREKRRVFFRAFLLSAILLSGLLLLASILLFSWPSLELPVNPLVCVGIGCLASAAFSLFWAFYHCSITVTLDDNGLRLFRGKRCYRSFAPDAVFRPRNVSYQAGFLLLFSRGLIVKTKQRKEKRIPLFCINETDFYQIVQRLNTPQKEILPKVSALLQNQIRTGSFLIPRQRILDAKKSLAAKEFCILVPIGIACAIGLYLATASPFSFLFVLLCLAAGWLIEHGSDASLSRKKIPEQIHITENGLYVDQNAFAQREIKEIVLTAPAHSSVHNGRYSFRSMMIRTVSGIGSIYLLGHGEGAATAMIYEEYELLAATLENWCAEYGVPLRKGV